MLQVCCLVVVLVHVQQGCVCNQVGDGGKQGNSILMKHYNMPGHTNQYTETNVRGSYSRMVGVWRGGEGGGGGGGGGVQGVTYRCRCMVQDT